MAPEPIYDVIVVGSGAAGGISAYVLATQGLKVLCLETGRILDPGKDFYTHKMSYEWPYRGVVDASCLVTHPEKPITELFRDNANPIVQTKGETHMRFPKTLAVLLAVGGVLVAAQPGQKPMKQFLNPEGVQRAVHSYTSVVTSGPGRMIFISGQGGAAADGKLPEDFTSQATNTFENLGRCLHAAGAKFDDIVKINYYLTDIHNQAELRRIRAKYLNQSAPPASTIVQAGLGEKGTLLEAEVIAVIPE